MTFIEERGLVAPEASALLATKPLPVGSVRLTSGLWADRQAANREASLAHGGRELAKAGNFQNFRNLLDNASGHGHADAADSDVRNFVDSDVYKWLEAVGWESVRGLLSAEVEAQAEEAVELIVAAQDEDGYLNTWYQTLDHSQRFTNMQFGHELYCLGHLIQAAIAYNRARGDNRLLIVARRFADLVVYTFGENGRREVCGHPEIEMSLVELSRETGDERYAALAKAFIDRRGYGSLGEGRFGSAYYQDRQPYREMSNVEGHAVRAVYLGAGATDAAIDTEDEGLLAASATQWSNMVASKMYVTGGIGSRHWGESFGDEFELPADRAYCETCGAIGVTMWSWRLLLTDVQGRYGDIIERSLLNGFLAGVSEDGTAFNYVNPLQVRTEHPRQSWFEIACCPPNAMRALASVEHYIATADEATVFIHQFAGCEIDAGFGRSLRVSTDFPWAGSVHIEVESVGAGEWALSVRAPSWAGKQRMPHRARTAISRCRGSGLQATWSTWISACRCVSSLRPLRRMLFAEPSQSSAAPSSTASRSRGFREGCDSRMFAYPRVQASPNEPAVTTCPL
jgi:DUF1680 family protein